MKGEKIIGVISVMNYKGGVGKTTLSANIAAELANRGKHVLLIDLDPQTNLTLSFMRFEEWLALDRQERTIKHWYDDFLDRDGEVSLGDLIVTPYVVNQRLDNNRGRIDLICSHLELIHVDMELSSRLGGNTDRTIRSNYLRVLSRLRMKLDEIKDGYDMVLIDCPPNFNLVTQNALVASDGYVVPAKADYLSTLGIDTLIRHVHTLKKKYNRFCEEADHSIEKIDPQELGVVFTMISFYSGEPIATQREYMNQVKRDHTCFQSYMRENKTLFAPAPETGIPVILTKGQTTLQENIRNEIKQIVDELITFHANYGGQKHE
ncbi:ParA family protein [Virgibacillus sp. SK37]|uniref:ParA family protein n=1 Tax=Virgibacillus sp. SK37 TaxID=403957 RepID=UPI0006943DDA|nr:AAA family ATPase [Virgibacillus sp. SK37]